MSSGSERLYPGKHELSPLREAEHAAGCHGHSSSCGVPTGVSPIPCGMSTGENCLAAARHSSMDVEAGLAKDDIVAVLFSEGRGKADVEFVRLAESGRGVGVVAEGIAGFDSVDERAKHGFELGDLLNVEDFAAGLVRNLTNVDEAGDHAGGEKSLRRIVAGNFQIIEDGI